MKAVKTCHLCCSSLVILLAIQNSDALNPAFAHTLPRSLARSIESPVHPRPRAVKYFPAANDVSAEDTTVNLGPHYSSETTVEWVQKLLNSHFVELGTELLPNRSEISQQQQAEAIASSDLAIASHDFLRDPTDAHFNYGNEAFLEAFGFPWDEFVELPSRACVSNDDEVSQRQKLLDSIKYGDVDGGKTDYENLIRVRKDGNKIMLQGVTLWNIYNNLEKSSEEIPVGQAVTIERIIYLEEWCE